MLTAIILHDNIPVPEMLCTFVRVPLSRYSSKQGDLRELVKVAHDPSLRYGRCCSCYDTADRVPAQYKVHLNGKTLAPSARLQVLVDEYRRSLMAQCFDHGGNCQRTGSRCDDIAVDQCRSYRDEASTAAESGSPGMRQRHDRNNSSGVREIDTCLFLVVDRSHDGASQPLEQSARSERIQLAELWEVKTVFDSLPPT